MNTSMRDRLGDLLAPVPADEAMPIDFGRRRWQPGRRAVVALAVLGVLAVAALAGWWLRTPAVTMPEVTDLSAVTASPPPADPAGAEPAGEGPIVVSVVGLVHRPGVVELPAGARVTDAIAAAGGMTDAADPASVNHARRLTDGEQILVTDTPSADAGAGGAGAAAGATPGKVNINTADAASLEELPGIGPATAAKILAHRDANGPFAVTEELMEVPGIGPAKFDALKDLVTT